MRVLLQPLFLLCVAFDTAFGSDVSDTFTNGQLHDLNELRSRLADRGLEGQGTNFELLYHIVKYLQSDMTNMNERLQEIESTTKGHGALPGKDKTSGTTYIRWGKTSCPGNGSDKVYSGYAGGSYYNHPGGAASMVCLPSDPIWKNYDKGLQVVGLMYGAEYDDRKSVLTGKNLYSQEVPCIVCDVQTRSRTMMIPGRSECYPGWTKEYWGYLMSGRYDHPGATDYYCVDVHHEGIVGREADEDGYLLYFVEARCGSLPCPPYNNGWELTCVVCTK